MSRMWISRVLDGQQGFDFNAAKLAIGQEVRSILAEVKKTTKGYEHEQNRPIPTKEELTRFFLEDFSKYYPGLEVEITSVCTDMPVVFWHIKKGESE